jgi:hypothetical protein
MTRTPPHAGGTAAGNAAADGAAPPKAGAGRILWTAAVGWSVIAYGVWVMFQHRIDTRPANLARFAIGGLVAHDGVVAPAVLVFGVVVARVTPGRVRAAVQGGLIVAAVLALFSYPLVRGYGLQLHNPSSLPHNYAMNLALVLVAVAAVAAASAVTMGRRRSGDRSRAPS